MLDSIWFGGCSSNSRLHPMMSSEACHKALANLPGEAECYISRRDAIAQGGVLIEIMNYPSGVIYGVFRT